MLYLIAPQTQGAKVIYQEHVHPFLQEHENTIEDFIASAHERAKAAGLSYLKQAFELFKQHALGLPPSQPSPPQTPAAQSYTQSLIARFNIPSARPNVPSASNAASTANDFYALLGSAVSAATSAGLRSTAAPEKAAHDLSNSGTLIPPSIEGPERLSFIAAQRERLSILLSALDKEASAATSTSSTSKTPPARVTSMQFDGMLDGPDSLPRPASAMSGLSKSRREADFESIDKDVPEEGPHVPEKSGSWLPWSWGAKTPAPTIQVGDVVTKDTDATQGQSSAVEL